MSYQLVIRHIQKVLNKCGDTVSLMPTGKALVVGDYFSVVIQKVLILQKNDCCELPTPQPLCSNNPKGKYWVNRMRISTQLAGDYSKNYPMTDEEIQTVICNKDNLFACYEED